VGDVALEVGAPLVVVMAEGGEAVTEAAERSEREQRDEQWTFHEELSGGVKSRGGSRGDA
jgi:hypothetical protein